MFELNIILKVAQPNKDEDLEGKDWAMLLTGPANFAQTKSLDQVETSH